MTRHRGAPPSCNHAALESTYSLIIRHARGMIRRDWLSRRYRHPRWKGWEVYLCRTRAKLPFPGCENHVPALANHFCRLSMPSIFFQPGNGNEPEHCISLSLFSAYLPRCELWQGLSQISLSLSLKSRQYHERWTIRTAVETWAFSFMRSTLLKQWFLKRVFKKTMILAIRTLRLTRAATRREVLAESPPWPETGGGARAPGRCRVCPRTPGFLQHEISCHNYPTIS